MFMKISQKVESNNNYYLSNVQIQNERDFCKPLFSKNSIKTTTRMNWNNKQGFDYYRNHFQS